VIFFFLEYNISHTYIQEERNNIFRILRVGIVHKGVFTIWAKALAQLNLAQPGIVDTYDDRSLFFRQKNEQVAGTNTTADGS